MTKQVTRDLKTAAGYAACVGRDAALDYLQICYRSALTRTAQDDYLKAMQAYK